MLIIIANVENSAHSDSMTTVYKIEQWKKVNSLCFSLIVWLLELSPVCLPCRHWHGCGLVHLWLLDQMHCPRGPSHCICCCDGMSTSWPSDWCVLCWFLLTNPSCRLVCNLCQTSQKMCPHASFVSLLPSGGTFATRFRNFELKLVKIFIYSSWQDQHLTSF